MTATANSVTDEKPFFVLFHQLYDMVKLGKVKIAFCVGKDEIRYRDDSGCPHVLYDRWEVYPDANVRQWLDGLRMAQDALGKEYDSDVLALQEFIDKESCDG